LTDRSLSLRRFRLPRDAQDEVAGLLEVDAGERTLGQLPHLVRDAILVETALKGTDERAEPAVEVAEHHPQGRAS